MDILQYILFISSSFDRHLSYFPLLATMNNTTMNTCVEVFVWAYAFISLGCIGVELLDYTVTLCLTGATARLFSKMTALLYIPVNSE